MPPGGVAPAVGGVAGAAAGDAVAGIASGTGAALGGGEAQPSRSKSHSSALDAGRCLHASHNQLIQAHPMLLWSTVVQLTLHNQ
jgi:hypothetical protein